MYDAMERQPLGPYGRDAVFIASIIGRVYAGIATAKAGVATTRYYYEAATGTIGDLPTDKLAVYSLVGFVGYTSMVLGRRYLENDAALPGQNE